MRMFNDNIDFMTVWIITWYGGFVVIRWDGNRKPWLRLRRMVTTYTYGISITAAFIIHYEHLFVKRQNTLRFSFVSRRARKYRGWYPCVWPCVRFIYPFNEAHPSDESWNQRSWVNAQTRELSWNDFLRKRNHEMRSDKTKSDICWGTVIIADEWWKY